MPVQPVFITHVRQQISGKISIYPYNVCTAAACTRAYTSDPYDEAAYPAQSGLINRSGSRNKLREAGAIKLTVSHSVHSDIIKNNVVNIAVTLVNGNGSASESVPVLTALISRREATPPPPSTPALHGHNLWQAAGFYCQLAASQQIQTRPRAIILNLGQVSPHHPNICGASSSRPAAAR